MDAPETPFSLPTTTHLYLAAKMHAHSILETLFSVTAALVSQVAASCVPGATIPSHRLQDLTPSLRRSVPAVAARDLERTHIHPPSQQFSLAYQRERPDGFSTSVRLPNQLL